MTGGHQPSAWLIDNADLLPRGGAALDVACGRGRHALWLARKGFHVRALDRNAEAVEQLRATARQLGLPIDCEVLDLECDPPPDLGTARYDAIVVFNYLHRPLVPALQRALAAGGRLVYETFTVQQAERGHPRSPQFLLKPGELRTLVAPLHVLREREGEAEGRCVASIVAEKVA